MNNQTQYKPWDKYEQDLVIYTGRFLEGELLQRCHSKVMELQAQILASDEPVEFEKLGQMTFSPINIGDVWATKNFACAWFRLTGKLPEGTDRENLYLEFDNDGEGLLVDRDGSALKGFTAGSPVFGVVDRSVEKRYYPLDRLIAEDGSVELYVDGASNSLLGEYVKDNSKLVAAAVVRRDPQMQDIYWDFDVLFDYVAGVSAEDPKKYQILEGLHKIRNLVMYNDPEVYAKAKKITAQLLHLAGKDDTAVTAVGHAHLDLAWLWPIRESKRKAKRTFANMLYLMERYPEFQFVIPQPQQLQWIKDIDPKQYAKIKEYARQGRIEPVGGGWVENDTNIPGEESLVRQELYGQKFWQEEFGDYVRLRWLPDTFGYSGSLPQILKLSGQDNFMTIKISWSNRTVFPYNTFMWQGIDGSAVKVHMPPEGNYNSVAGPRALMNAKKGLKATDPQDKLMVVYGIGDGGGGPSENIVQRNLRTADVPYLPKVKMGSAQAYFDSIDPEGLPVHQGEMYLEKHRATYTSQSNNKNYNRDFEEKIKSLEMLLSAKGQTGDKKALDALWKEVLLYQFHDIIPGSSIQRVYDETDVAYARILKDIQHLAQEQKVTFLPGEGKCLMNLKGEKVQKLEKTDSGYAYYEGDSALICPVCYTQSQSLCVPDKLVTDHYTVEMASDGSFETISENKTGKVLARKANRLQVFIDTGDAWDFEDDYRDQPPQFMQLDSAQARVFGELTELTQHYSFRNSKLTQTILLHKRLPYIHIRHDVNWKDSGYMLRAEFLPQVWGDQVHSDIQFGYLDRPTTDGNAHDKAQFEICCQKWMELSDGSYGFAVLNNTKNGYMAKQNILSLDLLRSTDYPCVCGDQKPTAYSYALYPHAGGFDPVAVDDLAEQFNSRYLYGQEAVRIPRFDDQQVQITAFKPAYDEKGFILRAFERTGKAAKAKLQLPEGYVLSQEVDLLEDPIGDAQPDLEFKPFQIRSFRIIKK